MVDLYQPVLKDTRPSRFGFIFSIVLGVLFILGGIGYYFYVRSQPPNETSGLGATGGEVFPVQLLCLPATESDVIEIPPSLVGLEGFDADEAGYGDLSVVKDCCGGDYPADWLGDGACDANFNCQNNDHPLQYDMGDCLAYPNAQPYCEAGNGFTEEPTNGSLWTCDGIGQVPDFWKGDGYCDEPLNCDYYEHDGGDCQSTNGPSGYIMSCDGNSQVPATWQGDGYCDMVLQCPQYDNDGGDCGSTSGSGGFGSSFFERDEPLLDLETVDAKPWYLRANKEKEAATKPAVKSVRAAVQPQTTKAAKTAGVTTQAEEEPPASPCDEETCPDCACCVLQQKYLTPRLSHLNKATPFRIAQGESKILQMGYSSKPGDGINTFTYFSRSTMKLVQVNPASPFDSWFLPPTTAPNPEFKYASIQVSVTQIDDLFIEDGDTSGGSMAMNSITQIQDAVSNLTEAALTNPCSTAFAHSKDVWPVVDIKKEYVHDVCMRSVLIGGPIYFKIRIWQTEPFVQTLATLGSIYSLLFGVLSVVVGILREKCEGMSDGDFEDGIQHLSQIGKQKKSISGAAGGSAIGGNSAQQATELAAVSFAATAAPAAQQVQQVPVQVEQKEPMRPIFGQVMGQMGDRYEASPALPHGTFSTEPGAVHAHQEQ